MHIIILFYRREMTNIVIRYSNLLMSFIRKKIHWCLLFFNRANIKHYHFIILIHSNHFIILLHSIFILFCIQVLLLLSHAKSLQVTIIMLTIFTVQKQNGRLTLQWQLPLFISYISFDEFFLLATKNCLSLLQG